MNLTLINDMLVFFCINGRTSITKAKWRQQHEAMQTCAAACMRLRASVCLRVHLRVRLRVRLRVLVRACVTTRPPIVSVVFGWQDFRLKMPVQQHG